MTTTKRTGRASGRAARHRVSSYGAWTDTSIVVKVPGVRGSVSVTVKTAGGSSSKYITVF